MQTILQQLQHDLGWFVEQNDHLMMVLSCTDAEVPYATKVLEIVEANHDADVFLVFAQNVEADDDAHRYVARLIDAVEAQCEGVDEIRAKEGLAPWAPLPAACHDPRVQPGERLRAMMLWVREQIPDTRNHVVVGLLPVAIGNPLAYATVVRPFLPGHELEPWTAGFRILLRDDRSAPMLVPHVEREPSEWLIVYEGLDLSPETLAQSLVEQTADRDAPQEQRALAMVQLAALDFSHRRYAEALRKWGALFDYYDRQDVPHMKALCLGGAADVLRATGKLPEAKEKYQQGLAYTTNVEHMPVMLNLLLGVGETCIALQHWEEAEGYLHLAEQIADATRLLHPRCDVMARRGLALVALGRVGDAFRVWRACADVARVLGYRDRGAEALRGLIELQRRAGMSGEVRKLEDELRALDGAAEVRA